MATPAPFSADDGRRSLQLISGAVLLLQLLAKNMQKPGFWSPSVYRLRHSARVSFIRLAESLGPYEAFDCVKGSCDGIFPLSHCV